MSAYTTLHSQNEIDEAIAVNPPLVDGQRYWLGAVYGTWSAKYQRFMIGNTYAFLGDILVWEVK